MSKVTEHSQIIEILRQLKVEYPNQGIGRHLSNILSDYPNYWGMSDKEFLFALEKYKFELDDNHLPPEKEIEKLVDESSSIENLREGIDEYTEFDEEGDDYGD